MPWIAGILVVAADPSWRVVGEFKAMAAAVVSNEPHGAASSMIEALLADMEGSTDPDEAGDGKSKEELFGVLEQCGVLIAARCNADEAKDLRTWVLRVARATAEARSEGGLLGIGAFASARTSNLLFQESMQQFLSKAEIDTSVFHHFCGPFKCRSRIMSVRSDPALKSGGLSETFWEVAPQTSLTTVAPPGSPEPPKITPGMRPPQIYSWQHAPSSNDRSAITLLIIQALLQ